MLRATGHAHMVTSNGISAEKLLGVAAHFHIQKLLKLRGCRFVVRRAHPPTILIRFASNAEGLATSDNILRCSLRPSYVKEVRCVREANELTIARRFCNTGELLCFDRFSH